MPSLVFNPAPHTLASIRKSKRKAPRRARETGQHTLDQYFWYTTSDDASRIATISNEPEKAVRQVNTYYFNPDLFVREPYPSGLEPGKRWPPVNLSDLLQPPRPKNSRFDVCVGDQCYTDTPCRDIACKHTLEGWEAATNNWQEHFELRQTLSWGIGVYTKTAFESGDILGWYAGEVRPVESYGDDSMTNAYLMELDIGQISGNASPTDSEEKYQPMSYVMVDGRAVGNWTRFINHSCEPYAMFVIRRVGKTRIMTVEAIDDIPAGVELTVHYGEDYFGKTTARVCRCGTSSCSSKKRTKR